MKYSGIYVIQNIVNDKIYIGSSVNMHKRRISHYNCLRRGMHNNVKLQNAFNKYGESNFTFSVVECVKDKSNLIDREQVWLDFLKPEYNICPSANKLIISEETRLRLSLSHIGNKHTEESKKKIGEASKGNKYRVGVKLSEEHKKAISNAVIGKRGRKGKDNPLYGKKRPKEVIDKVVSTKKAKTKLNPKPNCYCGKPHYAKGLCKSHYKYENRKKNATTV